MAFQAAPRTGTTGAPFVAAAPNASLFPDKNWIAVNSFPGTPSAGRIIVTFTLFSNTGGLAHPIVRVFSDDGGVTWSSAALIHPASYQVQGSQPVFLADGRLVIIYWNFNGTDSFNDDFLEMVVSPMVASRSAHRNLSPLSTFTTSLPFAMGRSCPRRALIG